jgi:hypothetical protein
MPVPIVILLSVIAAIVFGVMIVVIVEVSQAHARRRRGPAASAGNAAWLRTTLRREVELTKQAVAQAATQGLPVGELRQVVAEVEGHAARLDQLLGVGAGVPAELRDRHYKLTAVCVAIRTDLADAEARRSSVALDDTLSRAQLAVEALRLEQSALDERRIAEIRKDITDRPDIG